MKKTALLGNLVLTVCLLLSTAKAFPETLGKIVAIVNDQVITQNQLKEAVHSFKKQLIATQSPVPNSKELRTIVINQLIDKKLQLQIASRLGIKVSPKEVNKTIAFIAEKNHLSLAQFKQMLNQQGFQYKQYEQQIKEQLLLQKTQQEVLSSRVKVTESDINEAHNQAQTWPKQFNMVDIFLPLPDEPTEKMLKETKEMAYKIRAQLNKVDSVEKALQLSDLKTKAHVQVHPSGWVSSQELPDLFLKYLNKMKPRQVSPPIEAGNGIHLLKLVDVKGGGETTHQIAQQLAYQHKFEQAVKDWLDELRKQSYIEIK